MLSILTLNFHIIHSIITKYSYSKIKKKRLFVCLDSLSCAGHYSVCYSKDFLSNLPDLKGRVSPDYASQQRKQLYLIKFSCTFLAEACSKANRSIFVIHLSPFCCCSVKGSYFCNYSVANVSIQLLVKNSRPLLKIGKWVQKKTVAL